MNDDPVARALWEGATTRCSCGRRRRTVDGNAPTVCAGCDNFPWNCHCPSQSPKSTELPDLEDDEQDF